MLNSKNKPTSFENVIDFCHEINLFSTIQWIRLLVMEFGFVFISKIHVDSNHDDQLMH